MDLNRQLFDHQLALMHARQSHCTTHRAGFEARADHIAQRIGRYQHSLGAGMSALLPAGIGAAA